MVHDPGTAEIGRRPRSAWTLGDALTAVALCIATIASTIALYVGA